MLFSRWYATPSPWLRGRPVLRWRSCRDREHRMYTVQSRNVAAWPLREGAASFFLLAWRPCPYVFWIRRSGRALARRLARAGARDFADGPRAEARARAFRTENVA